jgi:hypothetical protein
MLRADWDYVVGSGNLEQWRLAGTNRSINVQFEALARRAGRAFGPAETRDPLLVWLGALRDTPSFHHEADATEQNADGSDGAHHVLGTIHGLCIASADLCAEMESEAIRQSAMPAEQPKTQGPADPHLNIETMVKRVMEVRAKPEFIATQEALRTIRTYTDPEEARQVEIRFADEYARAKRQAVESNLPQEPSPDMEPIAQDRATLLSAFKAKARARRIKVTDEMVARAASPGKWNTRTMVTWWKRNDKRISSVHDRMIRAVLARDPASIWTS